MNRLSRLTALLCALLLCLSTLAVAEMLPLEEALPQTEVLPLTDTLSSYAALLSSVQEEQAAEVIALYESFMASTTLEELYVDKMLPALDSEQLALMFEFSATQIGMLSDLANELYLLIEMPNEGDIENLEYCIDTLNALTNGGAAIMMYATGVVTGNKTADQFLESASLSGNKYSIKLTGNVKITDAKAITIPAGTDYTIDLNGYALQGNGATSVIVNNGTLTIMDSNGGKGSHKGTMKEVTIYRYWRYQWAADKDPGTFTKEPTANSYGIRQVTREMWTYDGTGSVVIDGGIITGGKAVGGNGGGIHNVGKLTFQSGTIVGCHAAITSTSSNNGNGGGIYNGSTGTLSMTGGKITHNRADKGGGGIANLSGAIGSMTGGIISYNYCTSSGGGINVQDGNGTFTMDGGTVSNNYTEDYSYTGNGAGIHVQSAVFEFKSGNINNNVSSNSGGGIYSYYGGNIEATGGSISGNRSGGSGGGICQQYGNVKLNGVTISGNTATGRGGGITARIGDVELINCTIKNNTAGYGGGVSITADNDHNPHNDDGTSGANARIVGGTISGNKATSSGGGGVYISVQNSLSICKVDIDGITLKENHADNGRGGGFFIEGAEVTVTGNVTISGNTAKNGGAMYLKDQYTENAYNFNETGEETGDPAYPHKKSHYTPIKFSIDQGTVNNNTASEWGGAIYITCGSAKNETDKARNSIVIGAANGSNDSLKCQNNSAQYGGAFYVGAGSPVLNCGTFSENTALNAGGAFYVVNGTMTMNNGLLTGNGIKDGTVVTAQGGAIGVYNGAFIMANGTFSGNKAKNYGGAVYVTGTGASFNMTNGTAENNAAARGGAVYVSGGAFSMGNGTFTGNNATADGGAVYVTGGSFTMDDGTLSSNKATSNGGAIYVTGGTFTMTTGTMSNNTAGGNGGAAYVAKGSSTADWQFDMANGVMNNNSAANGGAVYVDGGNFRMSAGEAKSNKATSNGGAVYISGGSFKMVNGEFDGNNAVNNGGAIYISGNGGFEMTNGKINNNYTTAADSLGGAVWMNGGNFTMTQGQIMYNGIKDDVVKVKSGGAVYMKGGTFTMISGEMKYNQSNEYGGGVFAEGGSIIIGVKDCTGAGTNHSITHTTLKHPDVIDNFARAGGGFATNGQGVVTMHCGKLITNHADNDGLGHNLFIMGGQFIIHNGTLGEETNPGTVVIGGQFNDNRAYDETKQQKIKYHSNYFFGEEKTYEANSIEGKYINLPQPMQDWKVPDGYVFVGWTTDEHKAGVQSKDHYKALGVAIQVKKPADDVADFYAVWAPETNTITYQDAAFDAPITEPASYTYHRVPETGSKLTIPAPTRSGYIFDGWALTVDRSQQITNGTQTYTYGHGDWGKDEGKDALYLPMNEDGTTTIETGSYFGHIILTAQWTASFSGLEIVVKDAEEDDGDSFCFKVYGVPADTGKAPFTMYVSIVPDQSDSVTIYNLPVGEYTITELSGWSWRYVVESIDNNEELSFATFGRRSSGENCVTTVNIPSIEKGRRIVFDMSRNVPEWLDDNENIKH